MNAMLEVQFDQPDAAEMIEQLGADEVDELPFGVIGFDAAGLVRRYNRRESTLAGLSTERVLGSPLFTAVAPCMNNFLVAQRFEDAAADGTRLDAILDYVFTLRMRPVKVKLRLLAGPDLSLRYVLVHRP
jgi:photoactive yellow protein